MSFLILINKEGLREFNIDAKFIYVLIATGAVIVIFYLPLPINVLVVLLVAVVVKGLREGNHLFFEEKTHSNFLFYVVGSILPILPLYIFSIYLSGVPNLKSINLGTVFYEANILGIVYEELLFRGALWAILRKFNVKKDLILICSIFAFWSSHYKMVLEGVDYSFWIILPYISIYYGLMIAKGQSLFKTFVYHGLMNILTTAYKLAFLCC
jgi:hypothetical protein